MIDINQRLRDGLSNFIADLGKSVADLDARVSSLITQRDELDKEIQTATAKRAEMLADIDTVTTAAVNLSKISL